MQSFEFLRATPKHVLEIIELSNRIFMPDHPPGKGMKEIFPLFLSQDNSKNLFVALFDDRVVCHMGICPSIVRIGAETLKIASMGAVCTHPDFRGRGIATNLFGHVEQCLKEERVDLLLVSGGRGLYRRNGCVEFTGFTTAVLSKDNRHSYEWGTSENFEFVELPGECDDLDQVFKTYGREPVRFERTFDAFQQTLNSLSLDARSLVVLAKALIGERVVGYVLLRISTRDGVRVGEVREYAGDRRSVLGTLYQTFDEYGLNIVELCIPKHDTELTRLLQGYGVDILEGSLPGHTGKILTFSTSVENLLSRCGSASDTGLGIPIPLPGANYV